MSRKYLLLFLAILLGSQDASSRDWLRINGEYSSVVYPQGLEKIADSLLNMAEAALPQLAEAVKLPLNRLRSHKASIIVTDAPDFANGYTLENSIVIYTLSSEYMTVLSGRESWYKQVLTHELAHMVMFDKVKRKANWFGTMAYLAIPRWYWEGVAQYLTEPWNAYRGDLVLKNALFDGTLNLQSLYRTDDGALLYAASHGFVKYLAQQYGDSTIAKMLSHKPHGFYYDFNDAFTKTYNASLSELFSRFMRAITLYYGHKYHDYPLNSNLQELPLGNLAIGTLLPLSACDSSYIISVQAHPNHRYFSVYECTWRNNRFVLTKKLFEDCHTDLFIDSSGTRIAYGRYHLGRSENLTTYGFDWFIYNRQTGHHKCIKTNLHARYAAFTCDNQLIINQIRVDGSMLLRIDLTTLQEQVIFTTAMPLGRINALANGDLIIEGQAANGNRDLFLLIDPYLRNLTDDAADDLKSLPISDTTFIFTKYKDNHPTLVFFNINQNNATSLFYDLYDYWPEAIDREGSRLYLSRFGPSRKKSMVALPFDSLRSDNTLLPMPIPDFKYGGWQRDNSLRLADTSIVRQQPEEVRCTQWPLKHAFSFALPAYNADDGWGVFGLSSWFEIMQRQILLATVILFPQQWDNSFFLLNHLLKAYQLDFVSLLYQGPVFFTFENGKHLKLLRRYAGIMAAKPVYFSGNARYQFNPSLALAWQHYHPRDPGRDDIPETSYGMIRIGASLQYLKPTRLYPLLAKNMIFVSGYLHKSMAQSQSFSIYSTDLIVGTNILNEYLGFKCNASWMKQIGALPPPQFLGIDRFYQTNIPRDFGYTKTVRGVDEDIAGSEMFWTSNELLTAIPARTDLKLLFIPLDNPAFALFYDQAFIRSSLKDYSVFGYGLETTFGDMNFRYGLGYACGHYSDDSIDRQVYLRLALTIPGLSYMREGYGSRH